MTHAYYNEHDEFAADWLRNLIKAGLIADGEVDTRSIVDVRSADLRGFTQCHFFAGIGGWSYALRRAGWADSAPVWTGSCPCQPFSSAGAQRGFSDERHLWPVWRELIRECDPAVVFGEQVASATAWLRLVRGDLEEMGRAVGAMPIQAASAGSDHLRDRYWFVADDGRGRCDGPREWQVQQPRRAEIECPSNRDMADATSGRRIEGQSDALDTSREAPGLAQPTSCRGNVADASFGEHERQRISSGPQRQSDSDLERGDGSSELSWIIGADEKARRVKPGIRLLADGFPSRVGLLRGFGNAIDPRPAAAFIEAYLTSRRSPSASSQTREGAT